MTKKNYRGMKLDTQWSRYILDAMDNDDDELLLIALQSTLADINDVVIGGEDGSPMSIGDHGFFSDNQMDNQGKMNYSYPVLFFSFLFVLNSCTSS